MPSFLTMTHKLKQTIMKQQTAVEWLIGFIEPSLTAEQKHFFSIVFEKAKEMEKKQQTAVEWLIGFIEPSLTAEQKHFFSIVFEKAKEMEKKQIEDAVNETKNILIMNDIVVSRLGKGDSSYGEMYYNEVYGETDEIQG